MAHDELILVSRHPIIRLGQDYYKGDDIEFGLTILFLLLCYVQRLGLFDSDEYA